MTDRDRQDQELMVSKITILTAMAIVAFVWALPSVIGRYLVGITDEVSAISLSFYRALYGAAGLLIWVYLVEGKEKGKKKVEWWKYLVASSFLVILPLTLFYGVKWTSATASAFLLNANPVPLAIIAAILLGERLSKSQVLGMISALFGMLVLLLATSSSETGTDSQLVLLGNILSIIAGISWAFYTLCLRAWFSSPEIDPLETNLVTLSYSAAFLSIFWLFEGGQIAFSMQAHLLMLILGLTSSALGFVLFTKLVSWTSASEASTLQFATPVMSAIIGLLFLGDPFSLQLLIGAVLILIGLKPFT
ncbi:MAG: DMT family transporter [Candidatus Heimdallarchaeota archaeon]|nr:DMT family transporter [Candidatus Heimdallarchaeota archaeon]MCK5049002.1 DMT family transporter [Candidatus Heimdallarchaeota archaeon]